MADFNDEEKSLVIFSFERGINVSQIESESDYGRTFSQRRAIGRFEKQA